MCPTEPIWSILFTRRLVLFVHIFSFSLDVCVFFLLSVVCATPPPLPCLTIVAVFQCDNTLFFVCKYVCACVWRTIIFLIRLCFLLFLPEDFSNACFAAHETDQETKNERGRKNISRTNELFRLTKGKRMNDSIFYRSYRISSHVFIATMSAVLSQLMC